MAVEIDLKAAINAVSDVVQNRPRPLREFDQIYMKTGDMVMQSELVSRWADGKRLAFIGDGDAISVCTAYLSAKGILDTGPAHITVFDFDERIVKAVTRFADKERLDNLDAELYNCLDAFPDVEPYDRFYTNPPWGASNAGESVKVFTQRGIDQELFDRVQDVLDARSAPGTRDRKLNHYLKGLLFCDRCHQAGRMNRLIYTEAVGRGGRRYAYYLCRGRQDQVCDLPHLAVARVEQAVQDHYPSLRLPSDYDTTIRDMLEATLADERRATKQLHRNLNSELAKLEEQEDRLLDCLVDHSLPQAKIRSRLHKVQARRASIQPKLQNTSKELTVGADLLRAALDLTRDPTALYEQAPDSTRQRLNQAFYRALYIDEHSTVQGGVLTDLFAELHGGIPAWMEQQRGSKSQRRERPRHAGTLSATVPSRPPDAVTIADLFRVSGSSKTVMVELRGLEPLTPSMPWRCATSCATAPRMRTPSTA